MGSRYEIRYTEGFKEKVVGEVLSGVYSLCRAQKVYGIGGNSTIQKWIKKMERKSKGTKRVVVVQTSQEVEAVVQMERRARQLEKIIADQAFELKVWKELLKRTQVYVDEETKKSAWRTCRKKRGSVWKALKIKAVRGFRPEPVRFLPGTEAAGGLGASE